MATCSCGNEYPDARAKLGYASCLKCGEKRAAQEINAKRKRVAITYNKGGYQYITPGADARDFGRK